MMFANVAPFNSSLTSLWRQSSSLSPASGFPHGKIQVSRFFTSNISLFSLMMAELIAVLIFIFL
jgi:hypothetical protein